MTELAEHQFIGCRINDFNRSNIHLLLTYRRQLHLHSRAVNYCCSWYFCYSIQFSVISPTIIYYHSHVLQKHHRCGPSVESSDALQRCAEKLIEYITIVQSTNKYFERIKPNDKNEIEFGITQEGYCAKQIIFIIIILPSFLKCYFEWPELKIDKWIEFKY